MRADHKGHRVLGKSGEGALDTFQDVIQVVVCDLAKFGEVSPNTNPSTISKLLILPQGPDELTGHMRGESRRGGH